MMKFNLPLYLMFIFSLLMPLSINHYVDAQIAILPSPPTNLTAQAVSSSQINLSWTASPELLLVGYQIERSTDGGSSWSTIVANTFSTATTYSDTGLAHSTTYMYRVSAINGIGTSSPSNTASATTFNAVSSPPTGLTATAISSSQINLSWSAPSDNGGSPITGYKIERSTNGSATWSTVVSNTASTSTTYSDTGLIPNTAYMYRVSAINSVGTSLPSNTASATTFNISPSPPTGLIATAVSSSQINLSWTASSSGGSPTGYKIERSTDNGATWSTVVSNTGTTATTYSDTGLAASTAYTYRVSAINSVGTSNPSNTASATTSTTTTVPQPPTGLTATAVSSSQINLSWTAPSNNGGSPITGYKIERSTNGSATWFVLVGNTASTGTTYSDTGLSPNTTYTYRVSAINGIGTSSPSNTASATSSSTTTSQLTVNTQDTTGTTITGFYTVLYQNGSVVATDFSPAHFTLKSGQTYVVEVQDYGTYAFDHWLDTGFTNRDRTISITADTAITAVYRNININTPPQPPAGLTATAVSSSQINLSWTASGNGGSSITGYKIERSTDNGTTWSTVVSNTASISTTYSDTGLSPNTTYTYRVSAINGIGTSSPSNTASATTNQQTHSINLVQSGLVVSDSLNNETKSQQQLQSSPGYWSYGGDAIALKAKYNFWKDTQGLHIGVQSPGNGTWAGFYAVSPNTDAMLFHSVITTPARTIPSNPTRYYENAIYIQTSQPFINYVTCISNTNNGTTVWAVGSTTGDSIQATKFNVWYVDTTPNQPLTRDCTIITNGDNYLKVYIDGNLVFSNSTMKLQMPKPYKIYLEPQSSYSGQLLNGTYTDYYATSDENIQVTNNPPNAVRVDIVDTSGKVLASSPVSSGTAKLDVGKYHFPLPGTIKIYDSSNMLVESTPSTVNIFGGNVYSVN